MTTELQTFKYPGPDGDGGRNRPDGTTSFPMYNSDAVISTVQIFPKGTGNDLHTHPAQDGYWLVLGGRAKFLGEGDVMYWPTWVSTKGFWFPTAPATTSSVTETSRWRFFE